MRVSAKKKALAVLAFVVLVVGIWWLFSYHKREFKGGVSISDSGFFTYPRYHVKLGTIPLSEPGEYTFNISGLPPAPLSLQLYVLGNSDDNRTDLAQLRSLLEISITDTSGRSLCSASGRLSAAASRSQASWVLKGGNSVAPAFWQSACLDIPIHRHRSYRIVVRLKDVDPHSPRILLEPTLEGGGIELP